MIFGNFYDMKDSGVPAVIQQLLNRDDLSFNRLSGLEQGLYSIENTDITYLVKDFLTNFREQRPAEYHEKYIDLQLVIQDKDTIYFDNNRRQYEPLFNPKPDVYLVEPSSMNNRVDLCEGDFAIFLTHEPHQALCSELGEEKVKKVVFKIPTILIS